MKNKIALITGSSSGIGKEIALLFASRGIKVAINGRSEEKVSAVVNEIQRLGGEASGFPISVNHLEGAKELVHQVVEHFGGIDFLINNAGVTKPRLAEDLSPEDWSFIMETNLSGPFFCSQSVLPYMQQKGEGVIVNVSSIAGKMSRQKRSVYSASKAGLDGLTRSLAVEWSRFNIRVNSIAPGTILTEPVRKMLEKNSYGKTEEELAQSVPLRRLGKPEEIAEVAYFLCSPSSSYITGQVLYVDGGSSVFRP